MIQARRLAVVLAVAVAAAAVGCGLGEGTEQEGTAELRVTRDYGLAEIASATEDGIPESQTVLRFLEEEADTATRYGGRFVSSIEGLEAETGDRRLDWFFYVNGVESPVGAADVEVREGDRIWWDYRDWTDAMRVPAVVGSWPEPFVHGFEGDTHRTRIDCLGEMAPCEHTRKALAGAGVEAGIFADERSPGFDAESEPTLRVLVGPWSRVGKDPAAAQIEEGPGKSGVFARFEGEQLLALGRDAKEVLRLGAGTGLIAAVRLEEAPPTWVVTGTDAAGVEAAAKALGEAALQDRYAVVIEPGRGPVPVPVSTDR